MTAVVLKLDFKKQILIMLTIAILAFGLGAAFMALIRKQATVPLNPCATCGQSCGCPRLSGSIRCGCPQ